jgi:oxalate decarboxylase/phosphoglucose isomerase-like protein (cupin superfamily)
MGGRVRLAAEGTDIGARKIILLSSDFPPGKVHLLHRHPNAERIMYVL